MVNLIFQAIYNLKEKTISLMIIKSYRKSILLFFKFIILSLRLHNKIVFFFYFGYLLQGILLTIDSIISVFEYLINKGASIV